LKSRIYTFKWRRVTCLGDDFAELGLSFKDSPESFEFITTNFDGDFSDAYSHEVYIKSIEKGIVEALNIAEVDISGLQVRLEFIKDFRDETTPMAFNQCAVGAVLLYLDRKDLCPDSGPIG